MPQDMFEVQDTCSTYGSCGKNTVTQTKMCVRTFERFNFYNFKIIQACEGGKPYNEMMIFI